MFSIIRQTITLVLKLVNFALDLYITTNTAQVLENILLFAPDSVLKSFQFLN